MTSTHYRFGPFRLNPEARELRRDGMPVALSRRGFDCLLHLIEQRERACDRDELVRVGWGHTQVSDAQLGQVILRLRRSLGDDGQVQQTIRTVAGFGYRWVAPTDVVDAGAAEAPAEAAHDEPVKENEPAAAVDAGSEAAAIAPAPSIDTPAPADVVRPRPKRRMPVAAFAVLLIAALLVAAFASRRPAPPPASVPVVDAAPSAAVVLPFEVNGPADSEWVRLGAMDLVISRLHDAGVPALQSESVLGLLGNGTLPAQHRVIHGSATANGALWRVVLDARDADGSMQHTSAEHRDPTRAARDAADLLAAALGHVPHRTADEVDDDLQARLQRSQVALFSNQLDTARDILLAGRAADAAQPAAVRYRLAQIDYRAGRLDPAEVALSALLADPAALGDTRLHAQILCARGTVYGHMDRYADSERDFGAALDLARANGHAEEVGRALNGRGAARSALQKFDESLTDLGQARIALSRIGDEIGVARVDNNSASLEFERARPAQALPLAKAATARFAELGAINELSIALIGLGNAQAALLQWNDALATAERGWALRDRVRDPTQRIHLAVSLAEAQLALGHERDAVKMLQAAAELAESGDGASLGRLHAVEAELAWRQQRYTDAAGAADAALKAWPVDAHDAARARAALTWQRAQIASDRTVAGTVLPDPATAKPVVFAGDLPLHTLALAEWEAFAGRDEDAERRFRAAVAGAEARGVPAEIVDTVAAWVPRLLAAGRHDEAAALVGRVAAWADRDYACALLQLRLFHGAGQSRAWREALTQAQALAGERQLPPALVKPPIAQ
jgi:DNA-binding winged helix-turn-helix (wHTH) protein/tetratricopeptide (TPR) repeat protein